MTTMGTWGKHKATVHNLYGILWGVVDLLVLAVLSQCLSVTTTRGVPHTVGNFFRSKGPQITLTMGSGEGAGLPLPPPSQESRVYTCLWSSMSTLWAQTARLKTHSRYQKIKQSPGSTHYSVGGHLTRSHRIMGTTPHRHLSERESASGLRPWPESHSSSKPRNTRLTSPHKNWEVVER